MSHFPDNLVSVLAGVCSKSRDDLSFEVLSKSEDNQCVDVRLNGDWCMAVQAHGDSYLLEIVGNNVEPAPDFSALEKKVKGYFALFVS
ncbi:MAG: hypothetical protein ACPG05_00355 [Bdellovibrionales bacterium]